YPHNATPTAPVNGTYYAPGAALGLGTVVSSNNNTFFTATGLTASTQYDFYVYSFNAGVCTIAYKATSPLSGVVTTLAALVPSCASIFVPVNNSTDIAITQPLIWTGATGD